MLNNEYDRIRLSNFVQEPVKLGIPGKVGSKDGGKKKENPSSKKRKYS